MHKITGLVRSINVVSSPTEEILGVSGLERDLRSSITEDDKKSGQEWAMSIRRTLELKAKLSINLTVRPIRDPLQRRLQVIVKSMYDEADIELKSNPSFPGAASVNNCFI